MLQFIVSLFLQINLNGCHKVTETGLYHIVTKCKEMNQITLTGTNVMILPKNVAKMNISTEGYPCISPDAKILSETGIKILGGKYSVNNSVLPLNHIAVLKETVQSLIYLCINVRLISYQLFWRIFSVLSLKMFFSVACIFLLPASFMVDT